MEIRYWGYKILHGFFEGGKRSDLLQMANTSRLWGNSLKLKKERTRRDLSKFLFSQRVVSMYNSLSADVFTASTVRAFKHQLEAQLPRIIPRRSHDS